jgi:hypothetical protein
MLVNTLGMQGCRRRDHDRHCDDVRVHAGEGVGADPRERRRGLPPRLRVAASLLRPPLPEEEVWLDRCSSDGDDGAQVVPLPRSGPEYLLAPPTMAPAPR